MQVQISLKGVKLMYRKCLEGVRNGFGGCLINDWMSLSFLKDVFVAMTNEI